MFSINCRVCLVISSVEGCPDDRFGRVFVPEVVALVLGVVEVVLLSGFVGGVRKVWRLVLHVKG